MRPHPTKVCAGCRRELPRTDFALLPRSDAPTPRPDRLCRACRAALDDERGKRHRVNRTVRCACGCQRFTNVATRDWPEKGHVKGEPMRYLRGHAGRATPYPDAPYVVDPDTGCWIWQLGLDRDGYALMGRHGQSSRAARVYYEKRFGPLPDGYVPDHRCPGGPNRACVNPKHLVAVTVAENSRWKRSTRLDWDQVRAIRALGGTMTQREIAQRFGISQTHVCRILTEQEWVE